MLRICCRGVASGNAKDLNLLLEPIQKGVLPGFVWVVLPSVAFLAYPLRGLNEIIDPSKATSARSRKLGLRPQTCALAFTGRSLRPIRVPNNFIGPLRGYADWFKDVSSRASPAKI